jgi:hypothetical protein
VVLCFSILAPCPPAKLGNTSDFSKPEKSSGDETGTNWERVRIARLRTAGRGWERREVRRGSGSRARGGLVTWVGKREIRMERIESVSMSVSGGVLGCEDCGMSNINMTTLENDYI